jgi:hypothetical protein
MYVNSLNIYVCYVITNTNESVIDNIINNCFKSRVEMEKINNYFLVLVMLFIFIIIIITIITLV